jgi:hypothetical protein
MSSFESKLSCFLAGASGSAAAAKNIWRADLIAFDAYTTYATATRCPRPGGGMPQTPTKDVIDAAIRTVSSLVGKIEVWCREKLVHEAWSKRIP